MSLNRILYRFVWNCMGLAAFAAPVLLGGVHGPMRLALSALSLSALLAYLLFLFRRGFRLRLDGFALVMVAMLAMMFVQLLPLGQGLLSALSPMAADAVAKAGELGFDVPTRLSLMPVGTVELMILVVTALGLYLLAFNMAYRDGNATKTMGVVGMAGGLVGVITLLHGFSHAGAILWFYTPEQGIPEGTGFFSTFVNNNHGAALLNLASFLLIGQWEKTQFGKSKAALGLLSMVTLGASVALLSRGGILALVGAGVVYAFLSRWSASLRKTRPTPQLTAFGVGVAVAAVVGFLLLFNVFLSQTGKNTLFPEVGEETKVAVWEKAVPAIKAFKVLGAGGGAFGAALGPFNDTIATQTFLHAENEVLEPLVEYGVPVAAVLLLACAVLFARRAIFAKSDTYYAGAIAGLSAVVLQNLADYSLRVPGVLLPVVLVLGALSGAFAREHTKLGAWRLKTGALKMLPVAATAFLLAIIGGAWAASHAPEQGYDAMSVLSDPALRKTMPPQDEAVGRLVALQPADSQLFTALGNWKLAGGEGGTAERMYGRARELCPACLPPRVGLARLHLLRGEEKEALAEFLAVMEAVPERRQPVFAAVHGAGLSPDAVAESWGERPEVLNGYVQYLYQSGDLGTEEAVIRAAMRHLGIQAEMLAQLGYLYLDVKRFDKADEVATYLMGYYPEVRDGFLIQARVFVHDGRLDDALLMYDEAREKLGSNDVAVALEFMELLARTRHWDRFEAVAGEVRDNLGDQPRHRSRYHQIMAMRAEMRGAYFDALAELDQAEEATPLEVQIPLSKAVLHLKMARPDKAAAEYRRALKVDPTCVRAAEGLQTLERSGPEEGAM